MPDLKYETQWARGHGIGDVVNLPGPLYFGYRCQCGAVFKSINYDEGDYWLHMFRAAAVQLVENK